MSRLASVTPAGSCDRGSGPAESPSSAGKPREVPGNSPGEPQGYLQEDTLQEGTLLDGTVQEDTLQENTLRERTLEERALQERALQERALQECTFHERTLPATTSATVRAMGGL